MHSIESSRKIRNMQFIFGDYNLDVGERYDRRPVIKSTVKSPQQYKESGEVIAIATYNLKTGEIIISNPKTESKTL